LTGDLSPEKELLVTNDGSHTVILPASGITYRSRHGALQESRLVFIEAGLHYQWEQQPAGELSVFELGFGTGLNALLTCNEAAVNKRKIFYTTIDPDPLDPAMIEMLNFADKNRYLSRMHHVPWAEQIEIHPYFSFIKYRSAFQDFQPVVPSTYDLIYFDAFGPLAQPELWSASTFAKIFQMMNDGAALTTYCSKSTVRRTMTEAGLRVYKIPGPRGKREMVRAIKPAAPTAKIS